MKKIFLTSFIVTSLIMIDSISYTQNSLAAVKFNSPSLSEENISSPGKISAVSKPDSVRLNERNIKAIRHFIRNYKNATDVKWVKSIEGDDVVYFNTGDIKNLIFYSPNGSYKGMLREYTEDKLPQEVRHLIKSTYYDFDIFYVKEVNWDNNLVYFVNIEDKRSKDQVFYKLISVADGEMKVVKEFSSKTDQ